MRSVLTAMRAIDRESSREMPNPAAIATSTTRSPATRERAVSVLEVAEISATGIAAPTA